MTSNPKMNEKDNAFLKTLESAFPNDQRETPIRIDGLLSLKNKQEQYDNCCVLLEISEIVLKYLRIINRHIDAKKRNDFTMQSSNSIKTLRQTIQKTAQLANDELLDLHHELHSDTPPPFMKNFVTECDEALKLAIALFKKFERDDDLCKFLEFRLQITIPREFKQKPTRTLKNKDDNAFFQILANLNQANSNTFNKTCNQLLKMKSLGKKCKLYQIFNVMQPVLKTIYEYIETAASWEDISKFLLSKKSKKSENDDLTYTMQDVQIINEQYIPSAQNRLKELIVKSATNAGTKLKKLHRWRFIGDRFAAKQLAISTLRSLLSGKGHKVLIEHLESAINQTCQKKYVKKSKASPINVLDYPLPSELKHFDDENPQEIKLRKKPDGFKRGSKLFDDD